ncbi:hypothetical protein SLS58_009240 [Diplodia intermedia]|uniref:Uncharacterized protein n=1 Tax=Diplodia intermedia TaxID=856260 RepID=A0ABR3TDP2_9PEZI
MGIAAGGKLVQDIYRDIYPGPHWQKDRTRLINVQIFDAATFEAATHIVPPPTPVTAKTYADAGHPFWVIEDNPENRVGPSEALSAIKSVSALDKEVGVVEDQGGDIDPSKPTKWFSAPMNLPGEETYKANVPVVMLEVRDGRASFKALERMRM